jgi:transcriptional regulator with XRE-family HTH domain
MVDPTGNVAEFVKSRGFKISVICKKTGISPNALYKSLSGDRKLRIDEYMVLCKFFDVSPEYFMQTNKKEA